MNVKHILVFTICVVLPMRLYSIDKDSDEQNSTHSLRNLWITNNHTIRGWEVDEQGNIYLRIFFMTGAKTNSIFVPPMVAIGVNLALPHIFDDGKAYEELIRYFSKLLGVPKDALHLIPGLSRTWKTLKVTHGYLTLKEVFAKFKDNNIEKTTYMKPLNRTINITI